MLTHLRQQRRNLVPRLQRLAQQRRTKVTPDDIPRPINVLLAVEWPFAGYAFAPTFQPIGMYSDKQNAARISAPETGLEEVDERNIELAQRDGFDLHGSLARVRPVLIPLAQQERAVALGIALIAQTRKAARKCREKLLPIAQLQIRGLVAGLRPGFPCVNVSGNCNSLLDRKPRMIAGGKKSLQRRRGDAILIDGIAASDCSQAFEIEIRVLDFQRIEGPLQQFVAVRDGVLPLEQLDPPAEAGVAMALFHREHVRVQIGVSVTNTGNRE